MFLLVYAKFRERMSRIKRGIDSSMYDLGVYYKVLFRAHYPVLFQV